MENSFSSMSSAANRTIFSNFIPSFSRTWIDPALCGSVIATMRFNPMTSCAYCFMARADSIARQRGDSAVTDTVTPMRVADADSAKADSAKPVYEPQRIDVEIRVTKDRPSGVVALRGARIITMKGDEVIENGDIVVTGNRITAVGARGSITIPAGAHEVDVSGTTVMPGWIDVHAHI